MEFTLREISKTDLPIINQWRNDKELIDLLGNNFLYIAGEVDENWFENYINNRHTAVRLAIITPVNSNFIGMVHLTGIHQINRSAEFSILIGDRDYWAKGAGSQATKAMLDHAFNNLNLNRVYLTVLENNERAIKMYEKVGFKREGVLREAIFKNGKYCNLIQMSILKREKI
jgi:RimJ/RimL family protein N-acetyltransferase